MTVLNPTSGPEKRLLVSFVCLQRREAGRRTYVNMMSGENKVSWSVKDLIPNGEYYFRVQAVNKIGGGEFVELRNPVIAQDQKRKNQWTLCIRCNA